MRRNTTNLYRHLLLESAAEEYAFTFRSASRISATLGGVPDQVQAVIAVNRFTVPGGWMSPGDMLTEVDPMSLARGPIPHRKRER